CEVTARQRHPIHTVACDIAASWSETRRRRLVNFSERRVRRIGPWHDANHISRITDYCSPDRTICGTDGDSIRVDQDTLVLRGIERLVGLDVCVSLSIAVGIEDKGCPSLRLRFVSRLLEHLPVEPTDDAGATDPGAGP